ncbi:MAG: YigZ family protein [Bacteroidetes bacterium]|nr:YigZ family protein [Bacteroidota bacterium]
MMFDDNYKTIASTAEGIFKDRGSKFLAYAFPAANEQEVKEQLASLRKEHHSARHHCYAFRLGADKQFFRANDDGEPSGTGGKPILGQIQSHGLTNVLIVVVRYFGGTLLGVSGLIHAYRSAAADALAKASIMEKQIMEIYELHFPYATMNDVMKILKDEELRQWEQDFQLECKLKFAVRKRDADKIVAELRNMEGVQISYHSTS